MGDFNFGPIILLILFILIPLANYVLKRTQRRFEQPGPTRQPTPDMGVRRRVAPAATLAAAASRERAQAAPSDPIVAFPRGRWSRRSLFRTRRDVRRVIVAMTVLRTCRAYDPPG